MYLGSPQASLSCLLIDVANFSGDVREWAVAIAHLAMTLVSST